MAARSADVQVHDDQDIKSLRWSAAVATLLYYLGSLTFFVGVAASYVVENGTISAPAAADQIMLAVC